MSPFADYEHYDALGLGQLVARGEVSPRELLEAAILRLERHNPHLNAVIHTFYDRARAACDSLPDGPFRGVPFLLKDLLAAYAGEPLSLGSRAGWWVPECDAEMVVRMKRAGLNIFGKTNLPELGLTITTESKAHGPAHNPWRRGYSTGGSSGGSAAAVAARIVPMAQADDGGGSIRFPAACCGVFGFKPSRGRVPLGPYMLEDWEGGVAAHAVSLSVRDSAALLDAIHGAEDGSPYTPLPPPGPYLEAVGRPPGRLRIAAWRQPVIAADVSRQSLAGLEQAVGLLRSLGHDVDEFELPFDPALTWLHFITVVASYTAAVEQLVARRLGPAAVRLLEPTTRSLASIGRQLSAADYVAARQAWLETARAMATSHRRVDVVISPTLVVPPVPHGEILPGALEELALRAGAGLPIGRLLLRSGLFRRFAAPTLDKMGFTLLANMTGQPAMSVPLYQDDDGMPLGIQFMAAVGDDYLLFQLAGQLEQALPWRQRRPPLPGSG